MYMKKKERELSIYFIPYASHFRCLSINVIDMLYVKLPMLIIIIYIVHLNISALLVYLVPNTGLWSRQNPNDQFAWIPCNNIPCSLKRRSCDHRAKHEFVMQLNYSWIFNIYIYTNPRSSIIIETTVTKIIRSQYHVVIIIIMHRSWWHHEIETLSAL